MSAGVLGAEGDDLAVELEHELASTIGRRVREFRMDRGLTITHTAELSGISKSMLSKIENAHTSASLSTLAHLAQALEVPVTALFRGLEEEHDAYFVPAGRGIKIDTVGAMPGRVYELLGATRGPQKRLEPVKVRLEQEAEVFPLYQHAGTEFIYVLTGSVEYGYGTSRYTLTPGDALLFDGNVPHGPTRMIEVPIEFLTVKAWGRTATR